ncbi:phosphotransferase [Nonomuraea polychroma]|uniref:phosphotransferase n=1 Tax=Nonomuraea polychroma TaxID=46176 RepID=UPI003D940F58
MTRGLHDQDLPRGLPGMISNGSAVAAAVAVAAEHGLRVREPVQAVHGDAHPGNLLATSSGLLWNDFEETMAAPVGCDLACLLRDPSGATR